MNVPSTTTQHPVAAVDEQDHIRGTREAAVTIIEYGDYDCPHTRAAQIVIEALMRRHGDVRLVFRHFPLRQLHENADVLSRIAEAAARQDRFWQMHQQLMSRQHALGRGDVERGARAAGVELDALEAAVNEDAIAERVERDVSSGHAAGVHSTPSFFFNGVLHEGHYDERTLEARLADVRVAHSGR